MSRLRVRSIAISIDGFGAGPSQTLDNPLGVDGVALYEWVFMSRTFQGMRSSSSSSGGGDGSATGHR